MRITAFSASGLGLAFSCVALFLYALPSGGLQFSEQYRWIEEIGVTVSFSSDGLGLLVLAFVNLLGLLVVAFPFDCGARKNEYYFWLLGSQAAFSGLASSEGAFTFAGFWMLSLVPPYFLAGIWGGRDRERAAFKYFTHQFCWAIALVAVVLALQSGHIPARFDLWASALLAAAVLARAPVVPLHLWARDYFTQTPGHIAALAAGSGSACALYAVMRFIIPATAAGFTPLSPYVIAGGALSMMAAALLALAQKNLKAVAGCLAMAGSAASLCSIAALNGAGLTGGALALLVFPAAAALLLLTAEMLSMRFATAVFDDIHGLCEIMPGFGIATGFALAALAAVPLSGGFIAVFLMLVGILKVSVWCAVSVMLAFLCVAGVVVRIIGSMIWGKYNKEAVPPPLAWTERIALVPLPAALVFLGIYPAPALDYISTAVALVQRALKTL
ncbi:MAG: proton-conducting transporter membrane subunit [Candidatus Izemoplasmatales bacterium]|nr:proton-conducting transporter membrane subunit [Candidatus Izemoplasmatales bacterium]